MKKKNALKINTINEQTIKLLYRSYNARTYTKGLKYTLKKPLKLNPFHSFEIILFTRIYCMFNI